MNHLLSTFVWLMVFGSAINVCGENELGLSTGLQIQNVRQYNVQSRTLVSAYYKYSKNNSSFWFQLNHSWSRVDAVLPDYTSFFPGPITYKTYRLETKITSLGIAYAYHVLNKNQNEISLGLAAGACFLDDDYNVAHTRMHLSQFIQFTRKKILFKRVGVYFRVDNSLLGRAPGIQDANPAFYKVCRLASVSLGLNFNF